MGWYICKRGSINLRPPDSSFGAVITFQYTFALKNEQSLDPQRKFLISIWTLIKSNESTTKLTKCTILCFLFSHKENIIQCSSSRVRCEMVSSFMTVKSLLQSWKESTRYCYYCFEFVVIRFYRGKFFLSINSSFYPLFEHWQPQHACLSLYLNVDMP